MLVTCEDTVCVYIRDRYRAIVKHEAQSLKFPSIKNNVIERGSINFPTDVYAASKYNFVNNANIRSSLVYLLCIRKRELIKKSAETCFYALTLRCVNDD